MEVNNSTSFSIDKKAVSELIRVIFKKEGVLEKEVSVAFVEPEEIRRLNKSYLGRDYVTDVLSFKYDEESLLGEVVVCPYKIEEEGKKDFTKNILKVIIHGVLHLLDYDHEKPEEEEIMKEKTEYYLKIREYDMNQSQLRSSKLNGFRGSSTKGS